MKRRRSEERFEQVELQLGRRHKHNVLVCDQNERTEETEVNLDLPILSERERRLTLWWEKL